MSDCIFCKIVKGEIPSYKIWEDDKFYAFLDINPWTKGHALIIPKKHHDYLFDYNNKDYIELWLKTKMLSQRILKATGAKKIGVAVEGFEVRHIHIHLIPMNDFGEFDPCKKTSATSEELQEMQEKLKHL